MTSWTVSKESQNDKQENSSAPTHSRESATRAQFKQEVAGRPYAEQIQMLQPPLPMTFSVEPPVQAEGSLTQMAGGSTVDVQKKDAVQGTGSGGTAPGATPTLDLKTEARKDPVAAQKVIDVESDPACAALRAPFFAGAQRRLDRDSSAASNGGRAALNAMRGEIAANERTYLLKGPELPAAQLLGANGITRILDLPSLYDYNYLKPTVKAMHRNADAFVSAAQARRFNPDNDLDNRRTLRGKVNETWWAEVGTTAGMNLAQLIDAFHLDGDPSYPRGAVRLTVQPSDATHFNLDIHKPTAFDGMQQGWGTDPWWVSSSDPHWGLTKKGAKEVVMAGARLACFGKRELVVP